MKSIEDVAGNEHMFHFILHNASDEVSGGVIGSCELGTQVQRNSEELDMPDSFHFLNQVLFGLVEVERLKRQTLLQSFQMFNCLVFLFHFPLRNVHGVFVVQWVVKPSPDFAVNEWRHFPSGGHVLRM